VPVPRRPPEAARRQRTVRGGDLVDATVLARPLAPAARREVVRASHDPCAPVIARLAGPRAPSRGAGWLVSCGSPLAPADEAPRAVRAGRGMRAALGHLQTRLEQERGGRLAARLGLHTGLVVVGAGGGGPRQAQRARGAPPTLAARRHGSAAPQTLVRRATTVQRRGGCVAGQPLGTPLLHGQAQPLAVSRVRDARRARRRLEAVGSLGWTPLGGASAGTRAAGGALAAGPGRPRTGGAPQRGSGERPSAPGAGAAGTRGRGVPGGADAVPVCAV